MAKLVILDSEFWKESLLGNFFLSEPFLAVVILWDKPLTVYAFGLGFLSLNLNGKNVASPNLNLKYALFLNQMESGGLQ